MKSLTKKSALNKSTDLAILNCRLKSFQSLGAEATKARLPTVVKILKFE